MDPTACYAELVLAIRRGDDKESREYARDLRAWLDKGGFLPVGKERHVVERVIAVALDPFGDVRDGV